MRTKNVFVTGILASAALTALVYVVSLNLGAFQSILLPDKGADWYYWKLPHPEVWATVSMWLLYAAHQGLVWYLIYKIAKSPRPEEGKLGKYNIAFLLVNAGFIGLHLLQTGLFYDGLAQYVPIFTSQGSVIVMLVMILIMLAARRGLFFGKKVPLPRDGVSGVMKTHSYVIAWALVYTFWFHPTEGTWGHLLGFLYMFLLMLQGGLAKTKLHTSLNWIVVLEVFVGLHGTVVALVSGSLIWSMFLFGFAMMFVVTQMYGIIKNKAVRITLSALYLVFAGLVYRGVLGTGHTITNIYQIFMIPLILYGLVFAISWGYAGVMRLRKKTAKPKRSAETT